TDIGTEAAEVVPGRAKPLQIGQKILGMVHFFVKCQKTTKRVDIGRILHYDYAIEKIEECST
ncbi:MAG: hypothetical protein ACLR1P_09280, partial [Oscillospiraceae bacterium]